MTETVMDVSKSNKRTGLDPLAREFVARKLLWRMSRQPKQSL